MALTTKKTKHQTKEKQSAMKEVLKGQLAATYGRVDAKCYRQLMGILGRRGIRYKDWLEDQIKSYLAKEKT